MKKILIMIFAGIMISASFTGCLPAEFEVKSLTVATTPVPVREPVVIEVDISNVGGSRGVYTANLIVDDKVWETRKITLSPGANKKASFTCHLDAPGVHTIKLGGQAITVTALEIAKFEVSSLTITPGKVVAGEPVNVSADVTNIGIVDGIYEAVLTVDDEAIDTKKINIACGETEKVSFNYISESPGIREIRLNDLSKTLTVLEPTQFTAKSPLKLEPARFEVKSLSIEPSVVLTGQEAIIRTIIKNAGEDKGTYLAMLKVNGETAEMREITLAGASQETVSFALVKNTVGNYSIDLGDKNVTLSVLAVETYTSPIPHFDFSHPAEWELDASMESSVSYHYQNIASISVITRRPRSDWGCEPDLETVLPIWINTIGSTTPGFKELSQIKIAYNDMPAYLIEFSSLWDKTDPESRARGKMVITVIGSLTFAVMGNVRDSEYDTYWPVVETCMATLRTPPPTKILFTSDCNDNQEIYVMNDDGSNQTRLTDNPADDSKPAWSPDGTKIAFNSYRDGNWEIYTMKADGSNQTRLTHRDGIDKYPTWSPDGTKIAFYSMRNGNGDIYVMDANGNNQTRLTNNPAEDNNPAWSPDGTKIAFNSYRDGNREIYTMKADGSKQTRLTDNSVDDSNPAWSPDGTKIAFMSEFSGNWEIYIMDANGYYVKRLTYIIGEDKYPAWSPDGDRIVFISGQYQSFEIYTIDMNGDDLKRLTDNPAEYSYPAWR